MLSRHFKIVCFSVTAFALLSGVPATVVAAQRTKRPFTVVDEIALAHFGDPYTGEAEAVRFSPDGEYFAAYAERGRLDLDCPEGLLRFYRSQDVDSFLWHPDHSQAPAPVWAVSRSGNKEGPVMRDWRWLGDSSGVAFLESGVGGKQRVVLADLQKKRIELLTSDLEMVKAFDIRDRSHYVYSVVDQAPARKMRAEREASAIVGTGRSFYELLLPDDPVTLKYFWSPRSYLWAVVGRKRFEVKDNDGAPLVLFGGSLALSPDGNSLVTTLPVPEVPASWEALYPAPYATFPNRIRPGRLDVHSGRGSADQYVRINLQTGSVQPLTDAPISGAAGWWASTTPSWSSDGQKILLPGTFIKSRDNVPSRPCVAVVDVAANTRTCVEILKGHTATGVEEGYHTVVGARFARGDSGLVTVIFIDHLDLSFRSIEYRYSVGGTWQVAGESVGVPEIGRVGLRAAVKQWLNEPPVLAATNKQTTRVIWDPNPQLKNIDLGEASVYKWKDEQGREWRGGLYKPSDFKPGHQYPLVIQTHGFRESEFEPSGLLPTAFAARSLAAQGILVLQVEDHCPTQTPDEGPCTVLGYEAAARQLVSDGLTDPQRIGMIGFSRSCFYVMETLTTGSIQLKAASVTDGVMETYLQYMIFPGDGNRLAHDAESVIGVQPFGEGLQEWLKRSPGFNLNRVKTPLLVVGAGPSSLLLMWEPYAGLRYLHKPTELVMLNTDEHVLTNPAVRLASQGGTVDWFRFWLQNFEDPDPVKADQYARWRELRKLQQENENILRRPQSSW